MIQSIFQDAKPAISRCSFTSRRGRLTVLVLTIAGLPLIESTRLCAQGTAGRAEVDAVYRNTVQPLIQKYCYSCHGEARSSRDLRLDEFPDTASILESPETWTLVRERLELREMPPSKSDLPSDAERVEMIGWISKALSQTPCDGTVYAGRVTLRRLNRVEYQNTVRDLFGIAIDVIDEFPADDSGYGFDNIGDVLTIPPLLMERYLAAAERISETVIAAPEPSAPTSRQWPATQFNQSRGGRAVGHEARVLTSHGAITKSVRFPADGAYTLRIIAWGQQAGPDPARMAVMLDGERIATHDVTAESNAPGTYETNVTATAGIKSLAFEFINDYYAPEHKDEKMRGDRNLYIREIQMDMPATAEAVDRAAHDRIMICRPSTNRAEAMDCARAIVAEIASRAFRRPVTPAEIERYAGLVELALAEGESFERGVQVAIQGILVSPYFLFLIENEPGASDDLSKGYYALDDYALASRLSYFLWSTMPDVTLFDLAAKGRLHDEAVLEAQVRRMLADPRSEALVENFAGQWLEIRKLNDIRPDPKHFPGFDDKLRVAMREETEHFFRRIMREDRSVLEFLTCDYTYVNERLAAHYGMKDVAGESFRLVALEGRRPGGVISHASVLTLTSDPTRTSPVKRGKWVLEQILGTPPPPPPPDVPPLPEATGKKQDGENKEKVEELTLRQRLEQHLIRPDCKSCHSRMDPIGLGLENFDAIGAWREKEGSQPVDVSGTLPDGAVFNGPDELISILAEKADLFRACLTEKMLVYALGRGLDYNDRCTVQAVCQSLKADDDRFSRLIVEIVKSDPFRLRAVTEPKP